MTVEAKVAFPAVNPEAVPVQFVRTPETGVPSAPPDVNNVPVASGKVIVLSSVELTNKVVVLTSSDPSKSRITFLVEFVVNLNLPVPFAVKFISILVSPPSASIVGP